MSFFELSPGVRAGLIAAFTIIMIVANWRAVRRILGARPVSKLSIRWMASPELFRPQSYHWALSAASVFSIRNEQPWDSLRLQSDRDELLRGLDDAWGITDRASLLETLRDLLVTGHRESFQTLVEAFAGASEKDFAEHVQRIRADPEINEDDRACLLWRAKASRENIEGVQSADFVAWDMIRFTLLCQNAVTLDFITEDEARDFMLLPALRLQAAYRGWADCSEHFLRSRAFWVAGRDDMRASQETTRDAIALLATSPVSPWKHVAWSMQLPTPHWLFVRALVDAELLTALTEEERETASGWVRILDDALRQMKVDSAYLN